MNPLLNRLLVMQQQSLQGRTLNTIHRRNRPVFIQHRQNSIAFIAREHTQTIGQIRRSPHPP